MSDPLFLDRLPHAGSADRFERNLDALRLLHELDAAGRAASDPERRVLAAFSAFGESRLLDRLTVYDPPARRYVVAPAYRAFVTPEMLAALRRAALTAFYTPLELAHTLWQVLLARGLDALDAPRILEPALGVGHFLTAMPPALRRRAQITAVELDPVSARMAALIHPDITLHAATGFETVALPDGSFDLVISNVPFGDVPVVDSAVDPALRRTIHDYFVARSLRLVRPGGLVALLTSWGTLDKRSRTLRRRLHVQAELLGAFRLPGGVFEATSGTSSGADLLILRRRATPLPPDADEPDWLATAAAGYPRVAGGQHLTHGARYVGPLDDPAALAGASLEVNRHWLAHPGALIGAPRIVVQEDSLWLQVQPPAGDTARALAATLERLLPERLLLDAPDDAIALPPARPSRPATPPSLDAAIAALDGTQREQAAALAAIYAAARQLLDAELAGEADATVDDLRAALNQRYDELVARWGAIASPPLAALLRDLPELAFLRALECDARPLSGRRWCAAKAAIFTRRTVRPRREVAPGTLTAAAALAVCLDRRGAVDPALIGQLAGLAPEAALAELGERVFELPGERRHETADAYLSGDVRDKLERARCYAAREPRFARNVQALEAVQPAPLGPGQIIAQPSSAWLPDDVLTEFVGHLLPAFCGQVRYHHALGEWQLDDTGRAATYSVPASSTWGTERANAVVILGASLRGVPVTVYDEVQIGDTRRRVFNATETAAAQDRQAAIRAEFERWLWADAARAERLCAIYNRRFNAVRLREYDGSHLSFPGINTALLRAGDLDPHQKSGVWQALQCRSALLAFPTGAGKTFTAIAAAVEARRLGLAHKPLIVVPNNLVGQWADAFHQLYPGARVLAMAPEDFERERRGTALSRIATGDWDGVIIGETSLRFLPVDERTLADFREHETDRLRCYLEELRATASSREQRRSLKQIERAVARLEARLDGMQRAIRRDSARAVGWRDLGVDLLVLDEAHSAKNLWVPSRLNVPGVPRAGSQRALDCRIKTWELLRRGARVVFMTATPVMNSIAEVYVMQKYLQEQVLEAAGINHFDEWVSLFGEIAAAFEMKPDGSGFRMHTRLRSFVNLPELAAMWRQALNVRSKAELALPEPRLVGGAPIPVVVQPSQALLGYVRSLARRSEAVRGGQVAPEQDNMLRITGDGRRAALDLRLVLPGARRRRPSKIVELARRVATIYRTFAPLRGTQIVFCDLATPKGRSEPATPVEAGDEPPPVETAEEQAQTNFVYHEIRAELGRRGIPAAEVAFIHDYPTQARKAALFAAMNDGRVRVLIGSTAKMSVGMNVQQRLIALHNLDCPWRPGDLDQRLGRIQRQGNQWPEVYVFNYVTERSFDAYCWQTVETKARFIEQIMAGRIDRRRVDDVSELVLSAAEVKAIASGNPRVLRRVALELEVARMQRVRAVHGDTLYGLRRRRRWVEHDLAQALATLERLRAAEAAIDWSTPFRVEVAADLPGDQRRVVEQREAAGAAVRRLAGQYQAAAGIARGPLVRPIGAYRGLTLQVEADGAGCEVVLYHGATRLVALSAGADGSVFRSADALLRDLPERIGRVTAQAAGQRAEIGRIDAELERLAVWEGQAAYDRACAELAALDAGLRELEAAEAAAPVVDLAGDGLAEAQALLSSDVDDGTLDDAPALIPPASEALAWMDVELERLAAAAREAALLDTQLAPLEAAVTPDDGDHAPVGVIAVTPRLRRGVTASVQQYAWDF